MNQPNASIHIDRLDVRISIDGKLYRLPEIARKMSNQAQEIEHLREMRDKFSRDCEELIKLQIKRERELEEANARISELEESVDAWRTGENEL